MKAVIVAGGKGTRIASVTLELPKPMITINGIPVLEREIDCLRRQGIVDIILTVSYKAQMIMDYFGDGSGISPTTGEAFGVSIQYYVEQKALGNAGALFKIRDELKEDFLLLNADSVFEVDFQKFLDFHKKHGGWVTLFTHPNSHPYDSGLIMADSQHAVLSWLTKEEERPIYYHNRVNAGLHVISPKLLDDYYTRMHGILPEKIDLDRMLLKPLEGTGKMFCYDSPEYVKDMGTPDRYHAVCDDYQTGVVQAKSLSVKQKAIFLDRDGTINRYVGFLRRPDEMELLPGVVEAIKKINRSSYLAIVVTNQPVIARGEVTREQLDNIHKKMETLLGQEGVYIDALYYCPHHPDRGFKGEISELKINCNCRKPKPGMLLQAAADYNLDLSKSWMIGDSNSDKIAGINAGCNTLLVTEEVSLLNCIEQILE